MAPPRQPPHEQIERIRRAAESGVPKRDVLRIESLNLYLVERLAKAIVFVFAKVPIRITLEDIGAYDRDAALARAMDALAREVAAARLEIETGAAPPYKGRDWG